MRFARLGPIGLERPVLLDADRVFDLSDETHDIDGSFFTDGGPARVRQSLETGNLPELDQADGLRVGAPIARPSAVICIGMNYAAHAAESGSEPPKMPILFLKTPNTVVGPRDQVTIPKGSRKTDWEVELGIVVGKRASYLESPTESLDYVGGFVACNDLSERQFQLTDSGGQWSKGKSAPGFSPTGPWVATPDEVQHHSLSLHSWVNGEPRQDSNTSDMIFGVDHLIWHLSQYMVLEPGDLILTGTPEGVALSGRFPYLRPGDLVEIEIAGLGRQRQRVVAFE